jgi:hypothetical protein
LRGDKIPEDIMLSQIAALKRLRFYEDSCRGKNGAATDPSTREEMAKFQELFRRAASELEGDAIISARNSADASVRPHAALCRR